MKVYKKINKKTTKTNISQLGILITQHKRKLKTIMKINSKKNQMLNDEIKNKSNL